MKNIINRSFWISVLVIIVVLGSVCFAGDVVVKEGNITAVGDLDIDGAVVLNKSGTSTDDFVFGSPQLADDANTAHDSRFWFDKSKGAFRAGNVTGGQWDDANVGLYSFAAGYNNTASGKKSVAIGTSNLAVLTGAIALGTSCEVTGSGNFGVAIGNGASTTGNSAISIGWGADSNGWGSTAIGLGATADGDYSFAMGTWAEAKELNSMAMGYEAIAGANYALALGKSFTNSTADSFAVGFDAKDFEVKSDYAKVYGDLDVQDDLDVGGVVTVNTLILPVKTTTGDPASPTEGQIYVNTSDNKVRVYADGAWRDLTTW